MDPTRNSFTPIPRDARTTLLLLFTERVYDDLVRSHKAIVDGLETKAPLSNVVLPWCFDYETEAYSSKAERSRLEGLGFDGAVLVAGLSRILQDDIHLRKCCVSEYRLAQCLDFFIYPTMEATKFKLLEDVMDLSPRFEHFCDRIYAEPFKLQAFSHIFNFASDIPTLTFGPMEIVELAVSDIAGLLGEPTPYSFLHGEDCGRSFLRVETDEVIENDWNWVFDQSLKAEDFVRLLQYYKDGIVHVNYTSYAFRPEWVNFLRKPGPFFIGPHRKMPYDLGRRPFVLDERDYEGLLRRLAFFERPEVDELFGPNRNDLGEVISFAGYYFEASHTQIEDERRLVDLAIALEALFHPQNDGEITFQLSQLAGQFLGESSEEKQQIFLNVKRMYGKRSKLLHGSPKAHSPNFLSIDEIESWMSIIRRAVTKFSVLYLRGETSHKEIIHQIQQSIFDPRARRNLRRRADLRRFEREIGE